MVIKFIYYSITHKRGTYCSKMCTIRPRRKKKKRILPLSPLIIAFVYYTHGPSARVRPAAAFFKRRNHDDGARAFGQFFTVKKPDEIQGNDCARFYTIYIYFTRQILLYFIFFAVFIWVEKFLKTYIANIGVYGAYGFSITYFSLPGVFSQTTGARN